MNDNALEQQLRDIDRKLPFLERSSKEFHACVAVGNGTCGLGSYHTRMQDISRQSHLREWIAAAEHRAGQHGRSLVAIEASQREALMLARMKKEEDTYRAQEERRQQRHAEKKRLAEAVQHRAEELQKLRGDVQEKLQRESYYLRCHREQQMVEDQQQRAVDWYNQQLLLDEARAAYEARQTHVASMHTAVQAVRENVRHVARVRQDEKRRRAELAAKQLANQLRRQRKQSDEDARERRKEILEVRQHHQYNLQLAAAQRDERNESLVDAAKSIPNAQIIKESRDKALTHVRESVSQRRERDKAVRSVSALW